MITFFFHISYIYILKVGYKQCVNDMWHLTWHKLMTWQLAIGGY